MSLKNKFKRSGIKQFLEEIRNSSNIYRSYGNYLSSHKDQLDSEIIKDKTEIINLLRKKKFPLEKNESW